MKHLGSRVNLIPVIAKADTLTPKNLAEYKIRVSLSRVVKYENRHRRAYHERFV